MRPLKTRIVPSALLVGLFVLSGCRTSEEQQPPPPSDGGAGASPGLKEPAPVAHSAESEKKTLDVSFIPEDCFCALIIHPKRIADSPLAKEISEDVIQELLRESMIDPRKEQESVTLDILDRTVRDLLDDSFFSGHGEIIRFAEPIAGEELLGKNFPCLGFVEERTVAGKKYHAGWLGAQSPPGEQEQDRRRWLDAAVHLADERTMVYSLLEGPADCEAILRNMLLASEVNTKLVERLRQIDPDNDLIMVATTRPPDVPLERIGRELEIDSWPGMEDLLKRPKLANLAVLTVDLRGDPVAELVVEADDADSAAELKEVMDGALAANKTSFREQRDEITEGLPAGVADWVIEVIEQAFDGVTLSQRGETVTAALKRPGALAKLPEILTLIAEAKREERRRVERRVETPGEVGMIVVYEVDAESEPPGYKPSDAQMQKLLAAMDRRLNPAGRESGRVRQLDDGRIEASIFRAEPEVMQRIADLLATPGTLEFRILANPHDHKELIERAKREEGRYLKDDKAKVMAWWVPVAAGHEANFESYIDQKEVASRTRDIGDRKVLEILVVNDEYDVTGAYLSRVEAATDSWTGDPCISFRLNSAGGQLFGALTGENCPDEAHNVTRKLGIILDYFLQSAPVIRSAVHGQAQITRLGDERKVRDLVDVLSAGSLPVAIRKVEQRTVDAGQQPPP